MRRALFFAAVAAIVAVAVVALAPATLAALWIERESRGAAVLADAEGTVWRGRGTLAAGTGRVPFGWSVEAWPLLRGEIGVSLSPFDATAATPHGRFTLRGRTISARDLDVTLPLELARTAMPLRVTGEMRLTAASLDWSPGSVQGALQVAWRDARVGVGAGGGIDLGAVRATLEGRGSSLGGPIANEGGDVVLEGAVGWQPGSVEGSLLLVPRRPDDAATARILAAIGTPEGAGYRVALRAQGQ